MQNTDYEEILDKIKKVIPQFDYYIDYTELEITGVVKFYITFAGDKNINYSFKINEKNAYTIIMLDFKKHIRYIINQILDILLEGLVDLL